MKQITIPDEDYPFLRTAVTDYRNKLQADAGEVPASLKNLFLGILDAATSCVDAVENAVDIED